MLDSVAVVKYYRFFEEPTKFFFFLRIINLWLKSGDWSGNSGASTLVTRFSLIAPLRFEAKNFGFVGSSFTDLQ